MLLTGLRTTAYGMSTTLEVKRTTAKLLEELKRKYGARSMDETLRKLISNAGNISASMYRAHPRRRPFSRADEALHLSFEVIEIG